MNREEAAAMAAGNALSFLHVSRAEIDLPEATPPYSATVYDRAVANLAGLRKEAPLIQEKAPAIYLYQLVATPEMGGHTQTGIAATFSVEEYEAGTILRHEKTRADKEDDRTRHLDALGAQTGPVFLAYAGTEALKRLTADATREAPLFDFKAPDGVTHRIWMVSQTAPWVQAFASVPKLYIADGHHRAASAARVAKLRALRSAAGPHQAAGYFLAVAFPADELRILPYHRILKAPLPARAALEAHFAIEKWSAKLPPRGAFAWFTKQNGWELLTPREPAPSAALERLDVSVLQDRVMGPLLEIRDPRTDARIDFVGGIRGLGELERRVREEQAQAAVAMHPTSMAELMAVSDAGLMMPPKSTWFEPKLRDGLLSHLI